MRLAPVVHAEAYRRGRLVRRCVYCRLRFSMSRLASHFDYSYMHLLLHLGGSLGQLVVRPLPNRGYSSVGCRN